MRISPRVPALWPIVYKIIGFDRLNFMAEVTGAIPQNSHCRILSLSFEGDGIRMAGHLTVETDNQQHLLLINRQLRAIQGLISATQITPLCQIPPGLRLSVKDSG